ncbi:MAG: amidohydrolase family protein [Acidobacteria bacterium]|nr:amidohydrolase family protein [Acidobacteriota bacterium]
MRRILVLFLLLSTGSTRAAIQDFDLVVANGRVIDPESGLDAVRSVGVRGGSIAAIEAGPLRGRTVIDATGLVVAPGFIDVHRHGQNDENYRHAALDGVTSSLELEVGTRDIESWYRERAPGRLINYGVSIGHIGVRMAVMGDAGDFLPSGPAASAAATPEQVAEMARRLDEGLRQGAVAVGFGTAYTPAASPWEVLEMFRVAGRHGASAHIHVRRGVEGVQEALANAVVTGTPLHVVHINSTGGNDVGRMLVLISEARQRGLDVTTEAYPYNRGSTRIESALYDNWERMSDEDIGQILWAATGEPLTRESFARYRKQGGSVIQRPGRMENVQQAINSPLTMIASDASTMRDGRGHPRSTGTFSQVLGRYVREAKSLSLMDAVRKMTLMPARRLEARVSGMRNKGRLRVGADADLVVFDPVRVIDRSTYQQPALAPEGIQHVVVAGEPVVANGRVVDGVAPGRAIRAAIAPR